MARPTTRKRKQNGGDEPRRKTGGWAVFEADYATQSPRGDALARFATRAEAEAFMKGLNYHDPKTVYVIQPA